MTPLRRCVAAAGTALVMLSLAACGSEVPEGWVAVELDGLGFAHPAEAEHEPEGVAEAFWEYGVADSAELADAAMVVRGTGRLGDDEFAHVGVSRLLANYRHALPGFEVVSEDEIELEGASSAARVRYRYEDDDGREVQGVWFVAADLAERRSAAVNLVGRDLDDDLVGELQATIRVEPRDADDAEAAAALR